MRAVWLAIGSQLGYFRDMYGPQIFLLMNTIYYAPSIPILLVECLSNVSLEKRLGLPNSILMRAVAALTCYAILTGMFPFVMGSQWSMLLSLALLGTFSGLAFSASYQLVARFSTPNALALGLGCSASGPLVFVLDVLIGVKANPSFGEFLAIFSILAGLSLFAIYCISSLVLQNWHGIDECGSLEDQDEINTARSLLPQPSLLRQQSSIGTVLPYNSLEPHSQPFLAAGETWGEAAAAVSLESLTSNDFSNFISSIMRDGGDLENAVSHNSIQLPNSSDDEALSFAVPEEATRPLDLVIDTIRSGWPAFLAMLIHCTTSLFILPFFTYVPSSGRLGPRLPKALFYTRFLADFVGRYSTRVHFLSPRKSHVVLLVASTKLLGIPLFFLYMNAPEAWLHDFLPISFVATMWCISGYINSAANSMAPNVVEPQLKGTAAGLMAMTYQCGHVLGLLLASIVILVSHIR